MVRGRQCWKPRVGAGGRDQLLNNCSLHFILQPGLLGPSQKHPAAILPTLPRRNQGPSSAHQCPWQQASQERASGEAEMERRFPRHPTGPSCNHGPSYSQGCSCMEVWVFKLNSKKTAGTEKRKPWPQQGGALQLPPDSFPWAQPLGAVQQVTYPPSLSRRLRWRSTTGSMKCQATRHGP